MRQAIVCKYYGPTNHRGLRIVARAEAGRVTFGWDYGLTRHSNYTAAAVALVKKLGWSGQWHGGFLPDGRFVFVQADDNLGLPLPLFQGAQS
jgi:hypothetical protein